jgi:hypothetical protein
MPHEQFDDSADAHLFLIVEIPEPARKFVCALNVPRHTRNMPLNELCVKGYNQAVLQSLTSYFDASAWSDLARDSRCDAIVAGLRRRQVRVLASVISAGEILKTPDRGLRGRLCSVMLALHGDGPLLERPMTLVASAATACLKGESDFVLPLSEPGQSILALLHEPNETDQQVADWIHNLDEKYQQFLAQAKPEQPNMTTRYYSAEILRSDPFLRLLASCPAALQLDLSTAQVAHLCSRVDVWQALAGTFGFMITEAMSHSPSRRRSRKRPGGPDVWQSVYLGVSEIFVSSDVRLLEAATEVSMTLRYPRCVVATHDFLNGLGANSGAYSPCRICGTSVLVGSHALDQTAVAAS